MFERYTERARQAIVLGQQEARALKHNYIGTEHLLLGLLREEQGLAARTLTDLNVRIEDVRSYVHSQVGEGEEVAPGQIPFTPRAKKLLELSLREALALGHNYIGTEHVLLGLVRDDDGVAMRYLSDRGISADDVRNKIINSLSARPSPEAVEIQRQVAARPVIDVISGLSVIADELQRIRKVLEKIALNTKKQ